MHENDDTSGGTRPWKLVALAGSLTVGVVGMTVMTAGASMPAEQEVDRAAGVAERAAATESSVQTFRLEGADDEARDSARRHAGSMVEAARDFEPVAFPEIPDDWQAAGLDLDEATSTEDGRLVQTLPDDSKVTFTIDPDVQSRLEAILDQHPVPHGSIVLIEPPTGRVIAMAEQSERQGEYNNLTLNAGPPSASVFKVVTAAALMKEAGQSAEQQVCYHGGTRGLTQRNITGHPELDNQCDDLEGALAHSINSLIAKQTYHNLSPDALLEWAERFGYNEPIPFELPVEPSTAQFADNPYDVARAAAGFWDTHMSPLHGAMIGAAIANDGVMMEPTLIDRYESPDGEVLHEFEPTVFREVMGEETAAELAEMLEATAERGTARRYFTPRRGFGNIEVAGKTGTLSNSDPFLRFTWFVGHAEHRAWENHPGVAVAGLMANDPEWYMLGPQAASHGLRHYFDVTENKRLHRDDPVVAH